MISKVNSADFNGIDVGSNKYEDKINTIEISHARTRTPNVPLGESGLAILRLELGKLMWIARVARPGVMYDALAAAQTFPGGKMIDFLDNGGKFLEYKEKAAKEKEKEKDFGHMPGFA